MESNEISISQYGIITFGAAVSFPIRSLERYDFFSEQTLYGPNSTIYVYIERAFLSQQSNHIWKTIAITHIYY